MHINMKKLVATILFSLLLFVQGKTQVIFENHNNEVYNYLARMSQKDSLNLMMLFFLSVEKPSLINYLNYKKTIVAFL